MKSNPVRISVVSYLNSIPFVAGLETISDSNIEITLDIPSVCAEKLIDDRADIGLIPVAMIPKLKESHIISNYCIGADGKVASVLIVSNEPINEITSVIQDRESRTSVMLARILARDYWKISPEWKEENSSDLEQLPPRTAAVIIGNRALKLRSSYKYVYDLPELWKEMTGLPFVFACWVANKRVSKDIESMLNTAFQKGLEMRSQLAEKYKAEFPWVDIAEYFSYNIWYDLNDDAQKGKEKFLELLKTFPGN